MKAETVNDRDALAAKYFPKEWARVATTPGKSKARNNLRNAAEAAQKVAGLRKQGACCGNCDSFSTIDIGRGKESYCQAQSDFHGYAMTKANDLCILWGRKHDAA